MKRAALVLFLFLASGCAGTPSISCHPGQHQCQTDIECQEEEAYFLDLDELHQSDGEIEDLKKLEER